MQAETKLPKTQRNDVLIKEAPSVCTSDIAIKKRYPQLNNALLQAYTPDYTLMQSTVDSLIQFVMTLSNINYEINSKEVNINETNNESYRKKLRTKNNSNGKVQRNTKRAI
jgi:hypothetical protein